MTDSQASLYKLQGEENTLGSAMPSDQDPLPGSADDRRDLRLRQESEREVQQAHASEQDYKARMKFTVGPRMTFRFWLPEPDAIVPDTSVVCVQVTPWLYAMKDEVMLHDDGDNVFDMVLNRNLRTISLFRIVRFSGEFHRTLVFTTDANACFYDIETRPSQSVVLMGEPLV